MEPDPDIDKRIEWLETIRKMHRRKRLGGYLGCIIGVLLMLWGRFGDGAPSWTVPGGLAVIVGSWLTFVYILVDRWRWAKNNPFMT